jgi:hypothetical protein
MIPPLRNAFVLLSLCVFAACSAATAQHSAGNLHDFEFFVGRWSCRVKIFTGPNAGKVGNGDLNFMRASGLPAIRESQSGDFGYRATGIIWFDATRNRQTETAHAGEWTSITSATGNFGQDLSFQGFAFEQTGPAVPVRYDLHYIDDRHFTQNDFAELQAGWVKVNAQSCSKA